MTGEIRSDRVVLVTGANRGIGRGIAERLATPDGIVFVNYFRHPEEAEDVVQTIRRNGGDAMALKGDVSRPDDVKALMETIRERSGRLDVLINNAAIFPMTIFPEIEPSTWDEVMAVNVRGAFLCAQQATPLLVKSDAGRIINVTSTVPYSAPTGLLPYVTSKAALFGFTRALARELGPNGITVNGIATGKVVTEGLVALSEEGLFDLDEAGDSRSRQCIPRFGSPSDLAAVCHFLVSAEAGFITGQIIVTDGGRTFF